MLDANPGKWDNHLEAVSVIQDGNGLSMYYCGYAVEAEVSGTIIAEGQIGLAKSTDKINFVRNQNTPVLQMGATNQKDANALFSPTVRGPDNMYYLFISGDETIGVARSSNIFGPYEVYPQPIIKKEFSWESTSTIAPTVLIENGKARMWYMGVVTSGTGADFAIGYAEANFPFNW